MSEISVVVPVYKVEPYLHRCVDSILAQTYTDFELILVDDGSPDCCPEICDEYAQKDNRIVVIHQKNGGLSAARNTGIDWAFANSDSKWLSFIDSDDWVHPEYLERLHVAALSHNVAVSICSFARTSGENPAIDIEALESRVWDAESFFAEQNVNFTVAWGKLYKKECFMNIRYPLGKLHEDEFTTYKILFQQVYLSVIPTPLYAYFQNANGIMHTLHYKTRIHEVEALEEQMIFFRKHRAKTSLQFVLRRYSLLLESVFWQAMEESDFPEDSRQLILKKIRELVLRYGNKVGFHPLKQRTMFSYAFPRVMYIYDVLEHIIHKITRKKSR